MFQLVFKGECTPGTDVATARSNARALFKASAEQIERMFSGSPVVIRNKLDEAQAQKYRAVLNKHGMVAYVQLMPGSQPQATRVSAPPVGATPKPKETAPLATDSVSPNRMSDSATGVEPGDRLAVAGDKVDSILAGSALSLDPVGVTLTKPKNVEPPMFQHLDDWTVAPAGSDIGVEQELPPPIVPDVSHLSLVDEEQKNQ